MTTSPEEILNFWFMFVSPDRWFEPDEELDGQVLDMFLSAHDAAARGEMVKWEETPEASIALLLLLGALPRRMFRGTSRVFETDALALDAARASLIRHFDDRIDKSYKLFFYLPFSYAENIEEQRLSLFYIRERTKEPVWTEMAEKRFDIIERFGRFPDRNDILGRPSTEEELAFLADPQNFIES